MQPQDSMQPLLEALGWGSWQEQAWERGAHAGAPARVVSQQGNVLFVDTGAQRLQASVSGRLKHEADTSERLPVVGDWVSIDRENDVSSGTVRLSSIIERKSLLARRRPGNKGDTQLMAANIDCGLLVWGLDRPPNLRLLQRATVLARAANVAPYVVLTKADVCADAKRHHEEVLRRLALPVLTVSAASGVGLDALARTIQFGATAALIGPSGTGKSSLVNTLLGERRARTGEVNSHDRKGQHTTTHRELFRMPNGGLLLDGPGVREFGLLADVRAVANAFPDVQALAHGCLHLRCSHTSEPGCEVLTAVRRGCLERARLEEYQTLLAEAAAGPAPRARRGSRL